MMRLKRIKLAGFKSFVDPTTLELNNDLVAVVGPNGCGKSNVIDAVRWVMGESSAKHLRGESMTDVIFNGSTARKPVGQASVSLEFDNSDGSLGGEYASYAEISVRRTVTRDGDSQYYLNGTRCRRKDVTEVFLGTGLGPRSYAIIEQGMISRVIEAKPEELRLFLEEAAGISLYKERRRETERRMAHTRDNLARLQDLNQEQEKQLERLKRQSESAAKYQTYRQEQVIIDTALHALKWRIFTGQVESLQTEIRTYSVQLEEKSADRTKLDAQLEVLRVDRTEKEDIHHAVQAQYYEIGSDIAKTEQQLQHNLAQQQQIQTDLAQIAHNLTSNNKQQFEDEQKLTDLQAQEAALKPRTEALQQALEESIARREAADAAMQQWNQEWTQLQQASISPQQLAEREKTKIEQFDRQARDGQARLTRLQQEMAQIALAGLQTEIEQLEVQYEQEKAQEALCQTSIAEIASAIQTQKTHNHAQSEIVNQAQTALHRLRGEESSLKALQQAALGKDNQPLQAWLKQQGLSDCGRLATQIQVDRGFERAVEVVLHNRLQAICVEDFSDEIADLTPLPSGEVTLLSAASHEQASVSPVLASKYASLSSKIKTHLPITAWINGIFVANDWAEAFEGQSALGAQESIITADGLWIGKNWIKIYGQEGEFSGVLQREAALKGVLHDLQLAEQGLSEARNQLTEGQTALQALEQKREKAYQTQQASRSRLSDIKSTLSGKQARLNETEKRQTRLHQEITELQTQRQQLETMQTEARERLSGHLEKMAEFEQTRQILQSAHQGLKEALQKAVSEYQQGKDALHALALQRQQIITQIQATQAGIDRLHQQKDSITQREQALQKRLSECDAPIESLGIHLETSLQKRVTVEQALTEARQAVESIDQEMRTLEKQRLRIEQDTQVIRNTLDKHRVDWSAAQVHAETVIKKLQELGCETPEAVLLGLPESVTIEEYEQQFTQVSNKIQRLGAINLAAIEEYQTELERKTHIDAQLNDVNEALATLEAAIQKIDKETRAKFKATFDQVDASFRTLFPKLFGGGEAYLSLTGDDLLSTGMTVMARPPGKKNSSIHLLSGGEKALTAVSLVFAIFQLNPAPFCLLDEVDAPLDDTNVGRFCELVKYMSQTVQFIYITHNKLAMEMADQLAGVTMKEPGVSRLVAVDVKEAVALTME
jgi:chromosome segregation protein